MNKFLCTKAYKEFAEHLCFFWYNPTIHKIKSQLSEIKNGPNSDCHDLSWVGEFSPPLNFYSDKKIRFKVLIKFNNY